MTTPIDKPVAIVTGAGRGLGREHALALAHAGWAVLVNDLGGAGDGTGSDPTAAEQVVAEIVAMGGSALVDGSDVSNWAAAGEMIERAVSAWGRLDGLVNNAGILRDRTIANMTEEDWDLSIAVNLKGTAAPLHHAASYWRRRSKETGEPVKASVVNTSSASGLYSAFGQSNYAAAKAGVASLTLVAARELARSGVRVNAIAPVATTRLTESVMPEASRARWDPSLVSPMVVYLLSDAAGDISGRVFEVGGDGVVAVDMHRPIAGMRAADGKWTAKRLEPVVPGLVDQLAPQMDSASASQFLRGAPLEGE
ncbi:SDR family NAD(P)-dependent oxidoreductase [Novosphingobium pentaromativorans]|uniref:Short-chain dehydrogenase/reductase SDR n=1 Tax=Novosphingobium pentaromativorans US6-1 TaxID=1088721 RepID=G6EDA9_9SPHN|nr:SDR family NAD(P)-dependent oxidoreductase [Novosphingobium pentaromativorans]EHJ60708.1 Short-chain dehydrogenase/reductase SDR [Novosphingobium pentaromativorans US6-1]